MRFWTCVVYAFFFCGAFLLEAEEPVDGFDPKAVVVAVAYAHLLSVCRFCKPVRNQFIFM